MKRLIAGLVLGVIATLAVQRGIRYFRSRQNRESTEVFMWAYQHVPETLSSIPGMTRMLDVTTETVASTPNERGRGETMVNVRLVYETDGKIKAVRTVCRFVNGKMTAPSDTEVAALDARAESVAVPRRDRSENQRPSAPSPPASAHVMTAPSPPVQRYAVLLQETTDWNGTAYIYSISRRRAERTPDWTPERGEPPLSTTKAMAIAEKAAKSRHPKIGDFRTTSISLQGMNCTPVIPGKWFYMVSLQPVMTHGRLSHVWELVLLDGTVVTPTESSGGGGEKTGS
jgi:hypothetical protein